MKVASAPRTAAPRARGGAAVHPNAEAPVLTQVYDKDLMEFTAWIFGMAWAGVVVCFFLGFCSAAYDIRMIAIREFGPLIHEFDPYFNYRAAEYLYWNGWQRFVTWFDYMSWYPLGRPVGTTIYPGMQVVAVIVKSWILPEWSINDICCYLPAWFGVIASIITSLIAWEATLDVNTDSHVIQYAMDWMNGKITQPDSQASSSSPLQAFSVKGFPSPATECAVVTLGIMAIVPAHILRSIGGGFDNESVAMTAMVLTFYFWMRSLRRSDSLSHWWGIATGLAYFFMVATWGGYLFVLNLIGFHAAILVLAGRFCTKVWAAYSLFYLVGTSLALQVPVVGWAPLKSLEQLAPCAVFLGYQVLYVLEFCRRRYYWTRQEAWQWKVRVVGGCIITTFVMVLLLAPRGYFGPLSSRVRGLFVKHTKTGNPLVDSVAEHQAASSRAYFHYLYYTSMLAPLGFLVVLAKLSEASSFLLVWGVTTYFFSLKMVRLILLTSPIASVLSGILLGRLLSWASSQFVSDAFREFEVARSSGGTGGGILRKGDTCSFAEEKSTKKVQFAPNPQSKRKSRAKSGGNPSSQRHRNKNPQNSLDEDWIALQQATNEVLETPAGKTARRLAAFLLVLLTSHFGTKFTMYCYAMARKLSNPIIVQRAQTSDGKRIILEDYLESYRWLYNNTDQDARIMAWWDYGYQITGIANRTTLADGNTWGHEHISLLGKALTTSLDEGYEITRHLADYVLVWAGGGGDDLAKSPHMARITNSVYRNHCPDDPTCRAFSFIDSNRSPSAMMRRSLLYHLHSGELKKKEGSGEVVSVPKNMFVPVYTSKFGKVRIWRVIGVDEESKTWVADPVNRRCDVEGSWFCPGQYPPKLHSILSQGTDFRQLEDFNRGKGSDGESDLPLPNTESQTQQKSPSPRAMSLMEGSAMGVMGPPPASVMTTAASGSPDTAAAGVNGPTTKTTTQKERRGSGVKFDTSTSKEVPLLEVPLDSLDLTASPNDPQKIHLDLSGAFQDLLDKQKEPRKARGRIDLTLDPADIVPQGETQPTKSSAAPSTVAREEKARQAQARAEKLYASPENTAQTTRMWELIDKGDTNGVVKWIEQEPWVAYLRSSDGRGPMWWAYENRNRELVQFLKKQGVPTTDTDDQGQTPKDLVSKQK